MIIIKPRFSERHLGHQFLAAILGLPVSTVEARYPIFISLIFSVKYVYCNMVGHLIVAVGNT
jgi:hypothetical protein